MARRRSRKQAPTPEPHIRDFRSNTDDVDMLIPVREKIPDSPEGWRYRAVVSKSAIVLLVASWERYVEDLAYNAFDYVVHNARHSRKIPRPLRERILQRLPGKDYWSLAGRGWRKALAHHRDSAVRERIDHFATPSAPKIRALFKDVLGIPDITASWHWQRMAAASAATKLEKLIDLRNDIAHRVQTARNVRGRDIVRYVNFVFRLATVSHNRTRGHLARVCGNCSWGEYRHVNVTYRGVLKAAGGLI